MRIARFIRPSATGSPDPVYGVVEAPDPDRPERLMVSAVVGHPFGKFAATGERFALDDVRLLAPTIPSKVLGIGKNYAAHAEEMKDLSGAKAAGSNPLVFLKPSTTVVGPGEPVPYPRDSTRVDHEGELAVVIGRLCRDVPVERALDVVLGWTCANDVTARDQQLPNDQWTRAKGHDGFCPLGPWIETELDISDLSVTCEVAGELRQSGRTSELIHTVPALIAYITSFCTLLPGDVILTGTPAGVGPVHPGQDMTVTIEGIGSLTNTVVSR